MDNDRVTSHKLMFHPRKVADWLETGDTFPMYAEIGLSGVCNHRCVFCSADYIGYKPDFMDKDLLLERLTEMHSLGLKTVLFAGTGEPLTNPDAVDIINGTSSIGLECALSTNGVLFTKDVSQRCIKSLSWIRFSTSGGTEETYKKVHRGQDGDLERVFDNIAAAAEAKKEQGSNTVINVQLVLIPDNLGDALVLARKVRDLGADRFIVKTLGLLETTKYEKGLNLDRVQFYERQTKLQEELSALNTDNFECVFRADRVDVLEHKRNYTVCYGLPFQTVFTADGSVYPCCGMVLPNMCIGNIKEQKFLDIWQGEKRKAVTNAINASKLAHCVPECRLANINRYLHELVHPARHVNFI